LAIPPEDPFDELQHGDDQFGTFLNQGALLYRSLQGADDIASVLKGVWALDRRDLRRLALCTTMIAIQYEKGESAFVQWWESNPELPLVDEDDGEG
jgi:hypothetical protein